MNQRINPTKLSIALASILSLSACIEVEDDSNAELTATLQQQNDILVQQLNQSQQTNRVAFTAIVVDGLSDVAVNSALVTVKTATATIVENLAVDAGKFTVGDLPANSSLEVIISSPDSSFLTRVFYLNTGVSTSGVAEKDFGKLLVSEGKEYSITVANGETNEPITGLEFSANSNVGTGSSESEFLHKSIFDEVVGQYKIIVPEHLTLAVTASIDEDRDGRRDFELENSNLISGTNIRLFTSEIEDLGPILTVVTEEEVLNEVQFRFSIVDASAEVLSAAMVSLQDENNETTVTFDVDSGQYVIDALISSSLRFDIPAFSEEGISYQSASISIFEISENSYSVRVSNGASNSSFVVAKSDVIDIAYRARVDSQVASQLEVLVIGDAQNTEDNSLSIFYSLPISIADGEATLVNRDALTITRGNDSDSDSVLPGITRVLGGSDIGVTTSMSLNDTKLTIIPDNELVADNRYVYNVGSVVTLNDNLEVNISGDNNISFETPIRVSDTPFDISMLSLDNGNFTNNGVAIVAQNSAGTNDNATDRSGSVYLYLPEEINQLESFILNEVGVTRGGNPGSIFALTQLLKMEQLLGITKSIRCESHQMKSFSKLTYLLH